MTKNTQLVSRKNADKVYGLFYNGEELLGLYSTKKLAVNSIVDVIGCTSVTKVNSDLYQNDDDDSLIFVNKLCLDVELVA